MPIPVVRVTREEMRKRVAYFSEVRGHDGGLPDSHYPGCERTLYNVVGFQPPEGEAGAVQSPVGGDAARDAAIKISEGFNLGFCRAKPGKGPMMHNHDTHETFMPLTGKWRCSWEVDDRIESFDLGPYDVISFPTGVQRRFENVTFDEPDRDHLLLFVIGGNGPQAEFSPEAVRTLIEAGHMPAEQAA